MTPTKSPIKKIAIALLWLLPTLSFAQITVDTTLTIQELVQDVLITGSCAETSNFSSLTGTDFVDENGEPDPNGIAAFDANGSDFPFSSGVVLYTGDVTLVPGPNVDEEGSGTRVWLGDADIEAAVGLDQTFNASWIQFDFVPLTTEINFNFIMASEEYNQEFECEFSDAFAFLITDQTTGITENLAVLPGTNIPIRVTNIRPAVVDGNPPCDSLNEEFFDRYNFLPFNDASTSATEMSGQTVELTATGSVVVGNPYTIKLVVVDDQDTDFNMAIFLEAGSFDIGNVDLGPDLLISNGTAACEGDIVTLDATTTDATSYTWFLNGIEITGETNPTLEVTAGGTYSVELTIAGIEDCQALDEIVIEFIDGVEVDLGDDLEVCEEDIIELSVPFFGDITTYAWFLNGIEIAGETNNTLGGTIAAGTYTVEVTFQAGCTFSDEIMVTISTTPLIDLGNDIESCLVDPVILDGTPTNLNPSSVTYTWTLNGAIITGETNPTLEITQDGIYEVTVSLDGCESTDIVVVDLLDIDIELGDNFNSCFDTPETLTPTLTDINVADATIVWTLDGVVLAGESGETLDISAAGMYGVEVTVGVCTTMDTIIVTQANPDGSPCDGMDPTDDCLEIDAGPDASVSCEEPCVDLTASILGIDPTIALPFTETTSYAVELVDCPLPSLVGGTPANLMDDTWSDLIDLPFTFSYFNTDYTSLTIGSNGQISFNPALATNSNGYEMDPSELLPFNDEIAEPIMSTEGPEFPFNTIYGAFHDIEPNPVISTPDVVNYLVSGTAPFRTFILNFNEAPHFVCGDLFNLVTSQQIILYETYNVIDVNIVNKPVCEEWNEGLAVIGLMGNDLTEFSVPPGRNTGAWEASNESWRFLPNGNVVNTNVTFEWTDEDGNVVGTDLTVNVCPTEDTIYTFTVIVSDDDGNIIGTSSDTTTVTVESVADLEVDLGEDQFFCDETSYEIVNTVTGTDAPSATFLWSTGETTQNITVTTTGTYTVEVAVGFCTVMESVFIEFGQTPIIDLGPDLTTCFDTPVILDASPTNVDPTLSTYQWFQDGIELAETSSMLEIVELGTYEVIVSLQGCTTSDSILISPADLEVTLPDGFQTCPNDPQTLVSSTNETGVSYQWTLNGDVITGANSPSLDINISPEAFGDQVYEVQITRGGCTATAQIVITLYDVDNCIITQGISPSNLDGLNDKLDLAFLADRTGIENLQIFNRHGRVVFEQSNYTDQWRGQTNNNNDLPTGTYFYVISFSGEDPEYGRESTGWIYLNQN